MNLLRSLLSGKRAKSAPADTSPTQSRPTPTAPHFVVGDIHGCHGLLEQALEQIDQVIGALELRDPKLVFVGDYIDRGPSSAPVLRRLKELSSEFPDNVTCLLGNHEQMMLDFIDAPSARYKRWFSNGAEATLRSFNIELPDEPEWQDAAIKIGPDLHQAMGEDLWAWLRSRRTHIRSGNLIVTHAGADPGRSMDDQSPRVLLWGHPEFLTRARTDGTWVAHGHSYVPEPVAQDGRISIDTAAHRTGRLSTAVILPDGTVDFLQTDAK